MSRTRKDSADSVSKRKSRPALTPDAREKQMISLAVDQAERQLKGRNRFFSSINLLFKARFTQRKTGARTFRRRKPAIKSKNRSLKE